MPVGTQARGIPKSARQADQLRGLYPFIKKKYKKADRKKSRVEVRRIKVFIVVAKVLQGRARIVHPAHSH